MAEDTVNQAAMLARLPEKNCVTKTLNIHGFHPHAEKFGPLSVHGSDALAIQDLMRANPPLAERLHPALHYTKAEVIWAVRVEMARSVEDVLARRCRALFLDAKAAVEMAPEVTRIVAAELGEDEDWQRRQLLAFDETASRFQLA
jgi:glycerol-3-phosphate dehydrogenase